MSSYTGTFTVEPDEFPLRAQLLIIRDDEIAFDFRYKEANEPGEEFRVDDKAKLQPEGFYRCDVTDPNSGYLPNQAIIYVLRTRIQNDGCFVEGFWHEREHGAWKFWGNLSQFEASSPESDRGRS